MCVCNWSAVRDVCPNYEVVVFQPQTLITPDLGFISIVTNFKSSPSTTPVSTIFLSRSFPSNVLPPSRKHQFIIISISLCVAPNTHLLSRHKAPPTWTSPAPTTCQPPPLVSASPAACLHLPPFTVTIFSILCNPRPTTRSLSAPGGFYVAASIYLPFAPALSSQSYPPNPIIFWFLVSLSGGFFRKGERPGRLHSL